MFVFCFTQKTAYEMRISDWSSDVCSSDLAGLEAGPLQRGRDGRAGAGDQRRDLVTAVGIQAQVDLQPGQQRGRFAQGQQPEQHSAFLEIGRASYRERVCQYV